MEEWFLAFLEVFNGVAVIRSQFKMSVEIHVDACLSGAGANWDNAL